MMGEGQQSYCPEPQKRPRARKATWFNDEAYVNFGGLVASLGVVLLVLAFLTLFLWAALHGGEIEVPQQHIHEDEGYSLTDWAQLITAITGLVVALGGAGFWVRRRHIARKNGT